MPSSVKTLSVEESLGFGLLDRSYCSLTEREREGGREGEREREGEGGREFDVF